jgi:hypothetical protein
MRAAHSSILRAAGSGMMAVSVDAWRGRLRIENVGRPGLGNGGGIVGSRARLSVVTSADGAEGSMAEKQSYEDKMPEPFRESLGEIDEIAQVTLKSHIIIEAQLVDILVLLVDEPEYLEKANLRFYQKANLLRAAIFHEDGHEGWPLVLAFNKLRNTIAHGDANEERTVQIEVLRGMLLPIVTEETKEQVQKANELEITTLAAAMASGFLVDVENQMRRELGPEETEVS